MNETQFRKELYFKATRSGGPGGQHANKVSTKVIAFFDLDKSKALNEHEKFLIRDKLENRLTSEDQLILSSDQTRSQAQNKKHVVERFLLIVKGALKKDKKRIRTRPSRRVKQKRAEQKKRHSEKKAQRRGSAFD